MPLPTIQALIEEAANEIDMRFRADYSGRGMFGRSCIAVVGVRSDFSDLLAYITDRMIEEVHSASIDAEGDEQMKASYQLVDQTRDITSKLFDYQTDNMGFDTVFYWSDIQPE